MIQIHTSNGKLDGTYQAELCGECLRRAVVDNAPLIKAHTGQYVRLDELCAGNEPLRIGPIRFVEQETEVEEANELLHLAVKGDNESPETCDGCEADVNGSGLAAQVRYVDTNYVFLLKEGGKGDAWWKGVAALIELHYRIWGILD